MTTLLVIGVRGQLARALASRASKLTALGYTMRHIGRPEFDFERPKTIETVFHGAAPALVINAAAWTAVDLAETERDAAARANDTGPARLGGLCAVAGIPFIHISTDYVFDGTKGAPYVETDPTNPTCVYGATKLAGEQKIIALSGRPVILRTSWLYHAGGKNFVRTMLAAAQKTSALRAVADQRGCPTSADDLADAIVTIVARIADGWREEYGGIFHAAGGGEATWYDFAMAIFEAASANNGPRPTLTPIMSADWPTAALRPADSRLDCGKLHDIYGVRLPYWRSSVARVVDQICSAGR